MDDWNIFWKFKKKAVTIPFVMRKNTIKSKFIIFQEEQKSKFQE